MNFKTPLCSHIDRFMVIVSKMRDGKYISLCYKISVFYFERVFHSFLMSQAPERYIIEYPHIVYSTCRIHSMYYNESVFTKLFLIIILT